MILHAPVVYAISLGSIERYGVLDEEGNFQEVEDPRSGTPQVLLPLTDDFALELPCTAELLEPDGSVCATIEIGTVEGRPACVSISAMPGVELTGELLRRAPMAQLVRDAAVANMVSMRDGFAVRHIGPSGSMEIPEKSRRRVLTDEFLQEVAATYRQAVLSRQAPAPVIQSKFGPTSPENARRWVMEARKAGFLGPSRGHGKAGEKLVLISA